MSLEYSFAGKKVLVTGGGQGIGREIVRKFHDGGSSVFALDKNPETIEQLKKDMPGVRAEVVDLTDWEATKKLVELFGPMDHLVNNAAIAIVEKFMDVKKEHASFLKRLFDVNVGAAINVTKAVAKGLIDVGRGGSVVNICSIGGRFANPVGFGVYSAAKAGLENLTKTMSLELGVHGIRVNCVLPGPINSPMIHDNAETVMPFMEKEVYPRMIFKRFVEPSEIADTVMFLLSPLSAMIVGESVVVDGGFLAC